MARNRILYILAAAACLAFSMAYKENISAVILAAVVIYPILAALTTFILLKLVKAEFSKNDILAEKDGTVAKVLVDRGATVQEGQTLIVLE